jgi:hypothetical protein
MSEHSGYDRERRLLELLRAVARRADALARGGPAGPRRDRAVWLRAEQECFERAERKAPNLTGR